MCVNKSTQTCGEDNSLISEQWNTQWRWRSVVEHSWMGEMPYLYSWAIEIFCQIKSEISSDLKFCMLYWCLFLSFIGRFLSCWRSWNEKKMCRHDNRLSYIQICQTDIGSEINHKENKTMFQPFIKWACWTYYGEASYPLFLRHFFLWQ